MAVVGSVFFEPRAPCYATCMRRREFLTLLGGVTALSFAGRAQQTDQMRRIGVLQTLAVDDPETVVRQGAFEHALQALGWTVGRNIRIDYRSARGDRSQLRKYVAEFKLTVT